MEQKDFTGQPNISTNQKEIASFRESQNESVIVDVINRLNSERFRYVVSSLFMLLPIVNNLRRKTQNEMPNGVPAMISLMRNFANSLKEIGVEPYGEVGCKFKITDDEWDKFDLEGPELELGDDVEIISPGLKYKGEIISLPKIQRFKV